MRSIALIKKEIKTQEDAGNSILNLDAKLAIAYKLGREDAAQIAKMHGATGYCVESIRGNKSR